MGFAKLNVPNLNMLWSKGWRDASWLKAFFLWRGLSAVPSTHVRQILTVVSGKLTPSRFWWHLSSKHIHISPPHMHNKSKNSLYSHMGFQVCFTPGIVTDLEMTAALTVCSYSLRLLGPAQQLTGSICILSCIINTSGIQHKSDSLNYKGQSNKWFLNEP